jgi:hypothetical protein
MNDTLHALRLPGITLAELAGVANDGRPLVRTAPGVAPQPALVAVSGPAPDWRAAAGQRAVVAFVDGDPQKPVVLGVVGGAAAPAPAHATTPRTLRVAAGEELRIECGKSLIWLRADGRIEIRGEHLISRSRGPNKVKGGSVHLN